MLQLNSYRKLRRESGLALMAREGKGSSGSIQKRKARVMVYRRLCLCIFTNSNKLTNSETMENVMWYERMGKIQFPVVGEVFGDIKSNLRGAMFTIFIFISNYIYTCIRTFMYISGPANENELS